ncbi:GNAT family N-acetyltransferase [Nocardia sp. CDC159]|uniref:GNAT family N-acetyltransferase n=1 Tax=Nocardia pulmonis TaxID=2951408 RepID=A0A9X2ECH6_9NOCA|nr:MULTISPECIES: GNAT family N-acetyltransferase [Nocardia]MCM6775693.1 GNAT family N-acetyltransferase [Nocardia pulmonis]MCM6788331.1 GNAT family N-acetyltransferase [Nocardia sp. CDC159]
MIHRATPADVPAMVGLVHDLAEYEKAREECTLTAEQLHTALFGPAPAVFAHVAVRESDDAVLGCAIWFLNYSTWTGTHGIYLEDLYVRPEARGLGLGRELVRELAREAVARGYRRVDWSVLDWNTPSIDFYKSLGAEPQSEWTGYRLSGEALNRLGAS